MKKTVIFIFILMSCASAMNAQFSQFHVGLAFPTGDFGDDNKEKFYLWQGGKAGGAAMGFNVGYKYYSPLSTPNLSLVFGIDVFYNGINSDLKDDVEKSNPKADLTFPAYLNIPVTAGLNYAYPVNPNINIYGEVALGLNYSKITNYGSEEESYESKVVIDPAFMFCYALEGGVFINKKYTIGLRYNQLGSQKFKAKQVSDDEESDKFKYDKALSISNVSLVVGITF